jgi:radical SAM superfamily enzyme YgiQ (UPF0313 family)
MTGPQIRHSLDISQFVKSIDPTVKVVWGGVHPSLFPDQTLANDNIDIVVKGEGEITFYELVERLKNNESIEGLPGIIYKKDGQMVVGPVRPFIEDLDELPHLPYDIVEIEKYRASGLFAGPSLTFFTSRGCPFPCAFCYNRIYNSGRWRAFSAKSTMDRIEHIVKKYGVRKFFIQDDNFIVNIKRFWELMDEMTARDLNIEWACLGVRIDTLKKIGDEGLQKMVRAGCRDIDIGIESGSPRVLKMIKKYIDLELVLDVNRMLAKYPINSKCTFIIGFPGESEEEVQSTVNFAVRMVKENPNVFTLIFVYCPYPGTELFKLAIDAGFQVPKRLEDWGNFTRDEWFLKTDSWLTPDQRKRYNNICFTSMFACKAGKTKISDWKFRMLFDLYHPLAKFRLQKNFHRFPVESFVQRKLLALGRSHIDDGDDM